MRIGMMGKPIIRIKDINGNVKEKYEMKNDLLNRFFYAYRERIINDLYGQFRFGDYIEDYCKVEFGNGNGVVDYTDSNLFNKVLEIGVGNLSLNMKKIYMTSEVGLNYVKIKGETSPGQYVGDLTEIGISDNNYGLITKSLIKDDSNLDTIITLGENDYVDLEYRIYFDFNDVNVGGITVNKDSVDYNVSVFKHISNILIFDWIDHTYNMDISTYNSIVNQMVDGQTFMNSNIGVDDARIIDLDSEVNYGDSYLELIKKHTIPYTAGQMEIKAISYLDYNSNVSFYDENGSIFLSNIDFAKNYNQYMMLVFDDVITMVNNGTDIQEQFNFETTFRIERI